MSTSRRTLSTSVSAISTAPEAECRAREGPPNEGANSTSGPAESSVVPIPAASARNARGNAPARSSTRSNSGGRRAGRSALTAATEAPGRPARIVRAPWSSAALRPAPGESGRIRAPSLESSEPATASSVTTTTSATEAQASAPATVSWAKASASPARDPPTAAARRLLASAKGFSGTTRLQTAFVTDSFPPVRSRTRPGHRRPTHRPRVGPLSPPSGRRGARWCERGVRCPRQRPDPGRHLSGPQGAQATHRS